MEILTADKESNSRDLHLLSIEGRGVCGLTALITLKEALRQYQYLQNLPQLPRPCDVFDLAGGTGTGGVIVIMLFRLRMSIDEAITAYTRISEDTFSKKSVWSKKKTNAARLEDAITKVISSSLNIDEIQAQKLRMLDDNGPKCFVGALTAKNLQSPTLFRTYTPPRRVSYNCTIVEAVRATTAEEPFFPSIDIGEANLKETFFHGSLRYNNPARAVLDEAMSVFPGQCMSCVLSIGSGVLGITGLKTVSNTGLAGVLATVVNDGERISEEIATELSDKKVFYCRLNVDHGLEDISFESWDRLGDVGTHTQKYLEKYDVTQKVSRLVQVLNRRTAIATAIGETLMVLSKFLDDLIPEEQLKWKAVVSEFIRTVEPNKAATETLNMQCALLRDTLGYCLQGKDFAELPDELHGNIRQLLGGLKQTFRDFPGQEDPMTHVNTSIQKLLQRFWVQNHIAGNIVVHDILKYIQRGDLMKKTFTRLEQHTINQNLANLNVAPFAAYDSSEVSEKASCFKGTRVKLLNEIASWIASDDASLAPIYVLDGVAGIGKSTIAKTVAEHAAGINALGASFFFSRDDEKRKTARTFFPTIAYQLAYYDTTFADLINEALLRTPHVATQTSIKQFSTLIMEPLMKCFAVAGTPILILIDALDECQHDGDALLKIFADSIKNMPRLKLFITTRPEYHIRNVLDRYHHLKRFHLQEIEKSVVQSDIRLYLDFHLSENQVRHRFPGIQFTWKPEEKDMKRLVETCGTLFIMASTAVKFVLDDKQLDPRKQLDWLLSGVSHHFSGSDHTTAMDFFYTQILLAAVPSNDHDTWFRRYQVVMGAIVVLQHPLPFVALSTLIDMTPDDVKRALSHLYSLVAPTGQDLTFRIHHKSFPDFVTSSSRCERRFLIDLTVRHLELGKRCLKILDSQLRPNICNLGPTNRFQDNIDIQSPTRNGISEELAYSLTHWSTHLAIAAALDSEAEQLLEQFARKHFLAWLEVLSIIGQVEAAYSCLDRIGKLLDGCKTAAGITREIIHDGCRFIALNIEIIKVAAGHVFSAFAFVPQDTRLFTTYRRMKGINFDVVSGYERSWNPTISIMRGHEREVNFAAFSGDGTKLASASHDGTVRLWDGHTGAEISVLRGHSSSVNLVLFSPDNTRLASASYDGMVRLWDGQTGSEISILRGHTNWVNSLTFSPDGTKITSASSDTNVRLWDGQTGAEIAILRGHTRLVNSVVFSPDGTRLASASDDGTVRLWNGQTGTEITVLQEHSDSVNSVVFSPDGTKLASPSDDGTVRLWDGQTGAGITVLRGHSNWVNFAAFSPDGIRVASASNDGTICLWDGQTGANMAVLRGHSNAVHIVVFSPDSTRLASLSNDGTIRLWDGQTGDGVAVLGGDWGLLKTVMFSPDGSRLASASGYDGTVRLWDGQTGAEIVVLRGHSRSVNSVLFSPDGTRLASTSNDGTVRLWDVQPSVNLAVLRGHLGPVNSVVFSPDGTRLASASGYDKTVRLWDGQTGIEISVLQVASSLVVFSPDGRRLALGSCDGIVWLRDGRTGTEISVLQGHSARVNSLVFSPDGRRLASASDDETVRLWYGETGALIVPLRGHLHYIKSTIFSPDSMTLASASDDRTIRLWHGQSGTEIATLRGHSRLVSSVLFSPDGTRLASASKDGTVRLWRVKLAAVLSVPQEGSLHYVRSVVFSPDGRRLASASDDGTTRLWDSQTGAEIAVLQGYSRWLKSVVFSPDGTRLASAFGNGEVHLWDGQTGAGIAVLRGHSSLINSIVYSPDGTRLASASYDGTLVLWRGQTCIAVVRGHSGLVNSLVFSRDGKRLASASDDATVRIWDGRSGAKITVLRGHLSFVNSVVFSPDDTRLASASHDGTVRLWHNQEGTIISVLQGHSSLVNSVVFSPDGRRLASASNDKTVRLWDGHTGAHLVTLLGHSYFVKSVVFSADGMKLASASNDKTVRLWHGQTGGEITIFRGHLGFVNSVVFSPDGTRLASASNDGTVRLWMQPEQLSILRGHSKSIQSVMFSPDGKRLASASHDGSVRLWDGLTGAEVAHSPGSVLAAFTLDSSTLLSIGVDELYHFNCTTGEKVATPLGITIDSEIEQALVPSSNVCVLLVHRKRPTLKGLLVVRVDDGVLRFLSLCWFPPHFLVSRLLTVSSLSRIAIGCSDGRVLLLSIDFSSLP